MRRAGGISCLKCENEGRLSPGLGPDSVRILKAMQDGSIMEMDDKHLNQETIEEIKATVELHIKYRLDRQLKTTSFLDFQVE